MKERRKKGGKRTWERRNFRFSGERGGSSGGEIVFTVKFALSGIGLYYFPSLFAIPARAQPPTREPFASYLLFVSCRAPPWGFIRPWATSVRYWNLLLLLLLSILLPPSLSPVPPLRCFHPRPLLRHPPTQFPFFPLSLFFVLYFYFKPSSLLLPRLPARRVQKEVISQLPESKRTESV